MRLLKNHTQEKIQDKLRQTQKLEVLGTLASVIAHDLNNQLTVVLGNLSLSLDTLGPDHPVHDEILEAQHAAQRCVEMTRGLVRLTQSVKPELKPVRLDQLMKSTERILRRVIPSTVPTRFGRNTELMVFADAPQLQQVILNLAANASMGMPDQSLLELKTRNGSTHVTISVSVSSIGKLPDLPKRRYQPFSVAEAFGDPSSLGLARDVEIVQAHGGFIERAHDGSGTAFLVSLPVADRRETNRPETSGPSTAVTPFILVVEDDDAVRKAAVKILLRKGYNVIEARDGEGAVELFSANADDIDLIFIDLTMPGISGLEALQQMRTVRSTVKAILASGYEIEQADAQFLPKPYSPAQLVRVVEQVLQ